MHILEILTSAVLVEDEVRLVIPNNTGPQHMWQSTPCAGSKFSLPWVSMF